MHKIVYLIFLQTIFIYDARSDPVLAEPYPYVARIYYLPIAPGHTEIKCSAAVYNDNWLITSTKCAQPSLNRKWGNATHDFGDLIFGTEQINRNCHPSDLNYIRYVVDVLVPPTETSTTDVGPPPEIDIALLKTNKPLIFTKKLRAIKVPDNPNECNHETSSGYFSAFGAWEDGSKSGKTMINQMKLLMKNDKACEKHVGYRPNYMNCAKTKRSKDVSSPSDTGGPLVNFVQQSSKQAPVEIFDPVLCGSLPISSIDRQDMFKNIDYYVKVPRLSAWIKQSAGPQNPNDFYISQ